MILAFSLATVTGAGQFGAFGLLLAVGFLYLVFSFLFDGLFGDSDADSPDHDGDIISVFSPKVIAIFLVGFGAAGALATHFGLSVVPAIMWAFGGGGALGALAFIGTRALYRQQCSSEVNPSQAVGKVATVDIDILERHGGEVSLNVGGHYMTYRAHSADGRFYPRGSQVIISSVGSNGAMVQSAVPAASVPSTLA